MKKLLLILFLFSVIHSYAGHRVNAEIDVNCIGTGAGNVRTYQVKVSFFGDCTVYHIDFYVPLTLGIYRISNDSLIELDTIKSFRLYPVSKTQTQGLCMEKAVYTKNITVDGDFYITASECCRLLTLVNVNYNNSFGSTIFTEVHHALNGTGISPPVYNYPIVVSTGLNYSFDLSNPDTFSDSTIYELTTPLSWSGTVIPNDNPPPKPYPAMLFNNGYKLSNPLGGSNSMTIERLTGLLSLQVKTIGIYAMGLTVSKYKNGILCYKQVKDITIYSCLNCMPLELSVNASTTHNLEIFPNPVTNSIEIRNIISNGNIPDEILIYNNSGMLIRKVNLLNLSSIDISNFSAGIYFIHLIYTDKILCSKFCKM